MARRFVLHYEDGSEQALVEREPPQEPPKPAVQLYQHKEDREVSDPSWGSGIRPCAPCPAVWVLKDDPHARMDRQWQYYLYAINYRMELDKVFRLLDYKLAFANGTGFKSLDNPGRKDYFFNRTNYAELPSLDKVRTTSRSVLTGTEQYKLTQTLKDVAAVAKSIVQRRATFMAARAAFAQAVTPGANVLKVWVFDSRQPPPLKPGRSYPTDISKVNPDDYLYLPETDREKFLVANIVNAKGDVVQFPHGALYPWFEGGRSPASFFPHIANLAYGDVLYPLHRLVKLPLGSPIPSPYRNPG